MPLAVAHEINTPIQYVSDSVYFLKSAFEDLVPLVLRFQALAGVLRSTGASEAADEIDRAWEAADAAFIVEQAPSAIPADARRHRARHGHRPCDEGLRASW